MHFSACSMTSRRSIWSHHVAIYLRSAASAAFSCLLLALSVGGCDHESPSSPSDDSEAVSDSGDDSSTGAVCVDLTEYEPGVSWFDFGECRVGEVTVAACSAASPLLRPCDASFAEWCGYQGGDIHACDEMELDLDAPYQCDNFSALPPHATATLSMLVTRSTSSTSTGTRPGLEGNVEVGSLSGVAMIS
jgi:hypothetical protein